MKGYETWSFGDKGFLFALSVSLLWHLFWFFSIGIVVSPGSKGAKAKPGIVSLGAVLDDSIFRTLVETKPQLSETFYRHMADFSSVVDLEVKTLEKYTPGEVVSVRSRQTFWSSLKGVLEGSKASPVVEFSSRILRRLDKEFYVIEGEAASRPVLQKPELPALPVGEDPALYRSASLQLGFTLTAEGTIEQAQVVVSSGFPAIDALWLAYFKEWHFAPADSQLQGAPQKDRVRIDFEAWVLEREGKSV